MVANIHVCCGVCYGVHVKTVTGGAKSEGGDRSAASGGIRQVIIRLGSWSWSVFRSFCVLIWNPKNKYRFARLSLARLAAARHCGLDCELDSVFEASTTRTLSEKNNDSLLETTIRSFPQSNLFFCPTSV